MPSAAKPLQTSANLQDIPLEQIRAGHNHRKHFDEEKLQELAESVRKVGVLQPVLIRPVEDGKGKVKYELVAGERRWRAAGLAKLKTIPALVRSLTDDREALEIALEENLKRADILPMEEAEGYRELHDKHQVPVEQLAERVGKSKEYVYGRLKLCELKSPAVRKALDAGTVSPSVALLVARIPGEKLQEQASKKILEGGPYDWKTNKNAPMSSRDAAELVARDFMLQLSKAPFNTKDAKLVPEAGACGPCPKRTGNCQALYPDVKSENVCTDPECFGKKKAAAFKLEKAKAAEKGQKLLPDSKTLWHYGTNELSYSAREKYVELGDKVPGDKKKRTFKELLGDKAQVVLARAPSGVMKQLLEKEKLQEAFAAVGVKIKLKTEEKGGGQQDYAKERQESAFRERVVARLIAAAFSRVSTGAVPEIEVLRLLVSEMWSSGVFSERWLAYAKEAKTGELKTFIEVADSRTLLGLVADDVLQHGLERVWNGYPQLTKLVCETMSLDLKAVEEEQRKADAAELANPPANGREGMKVDGEDLGVGDKEAD